MPPVSDAPGIILQRGWRHGGKVGWWAREWLLIVVEGEIELRHVEKEVDLGIKRQGWKRTHDHRDWTWP